MAVQACQTTGSRQDNNLLSCYYKKENRAIKKHGSLFFYLNYTNYQKNANNYIIIYYFYSKTI